LFLPGIEPTPIAFQQPHQTVHQVFQMRNLAFEFFGVVSERAFLANQVFDLSTQRNHHAGFGTVYGTFVGST
jgi:hypothetical protein